MKGVRSIEQFASCRLTTKTTLEIEKLRRSMYQKYIETKDPKTLLAISQKLDQEMNRHFLSDSN